MSYTLSDYSYTLPKELIAQEAIHPHHDARLIVIDRASGRVEAESTFWQLDEHIPSDRVIFFNNSRVLPARIRLHDTKIQKPNGEESIIKEGEILFLGKKDHESFEALIRPGKKFSVGTKIYLRDAIALEVVGETESGRLLRAEGAPIETIMRDYGELPLPPYIEYKKEKEDDYQTAFAEKDGSVAAPTASLHFTRELLTKIENPKEYLTLHVGLGTFEPIDTDDVRDYHIHSELIEIDMSILDRIAQLKNQGKKILAVGTTACRTLESLPYLWKGFSEDEKKAFTEETHSYWDDLTRDLERKNYINALTVHSAQCTVTFFTSIYIYPGSEFLIIDDLVTNFHLPESSLIVLIAAFLGREETMKIYEYVIREKYRFFSFGDGMYIRGS